MAQDLTRRVEEDHALVLGPHPGDERSQDGPGRRLEEPHEPRFAVRTSSSFDGEVSAVPREGRVVDMPVEVTDLVQRFLRVTGQQVADADDARVLGPVNLADGRPAR